MPYLKAYRIKAYMSQQMLADATGLAKGTITRAEQGDAAVSFPNILKLAAALHISPDELVYTDPDAAGDPSA